MSWRGTYWTESLDASRHAGAGQRQPPVLRLPGPRSPGPSSTASSTRRTAATPTKFKHVIEPTVVDAAGDGDRRRSISIVRIDGIGHIVGGTTRVTYGLNNRLYAKKETVAGDRQPGHHPELLHRTRPLRSSIRTTRAATTRRRRRRTSRRCASSPAWRRPIGSRRDFSHRVQLDRAHVHDLSPRAAPTAPAASQVTGGWSQRRLHSRAARIRQSGARQPRHQRLHDDPQPGQPPRRHLLVQLRPPQRPTSCSSASWPSTTPSAAASMIEYQTYNLGGASSFVVPQDHRFNISFTLAGIGTFSNFFGAFGGADCDADVARQDGQGPRHRRRRIHRVELRPPRARALTRLARHDPRQADLRGPAREPAGRHRPSAPHLRPGRRRRCGRRRAAGSRLEIVVHFAAETHVDRSILNAGEFITTDVFGTFVLLEAARQAPALRRFVQISTDEVYGSVPEGSSREDRRAAAAQPVLGEQGRRGSPGVQLLGDLRRAGHHHPGVEQLRAEPVPRKGDSALHHQRHRRHARCRSTATG